MSTKKISVIIPAYNEEEYLPALFDSLELAKKFLLSKKSYEIETVLVDNNSTDRTAEIAKGYGVTVVPETKRLIARVRNTGAKNATGDILCFVDSDNRISENALFLVTETIESGKSPCGGFKIIPDKKNLTTRFLFWIFIEVIFLMHGTSGGIIFCTREMFDKAGGFDERYFASEDAWLVRTMKKLAEQDGKKFANIKDGYIITSSRKFQGKNARKCLLFVLKVMFIPGALRKYSTAAPMYYEVRGSK